MAKLKMGSLKDFVSHSNTNSIRLKLDAHRGAINVAARVIQTGLEFSKCTSPFEVGEKIINSIERITDPTNGNIFSQKHTDLIMSNKMIPFYMDLDMTFYSGVVESLPKDCISLDSWNSYMIYYVDGRMLTVTPEIAVKGAKSERRYDERSSFLANEKDISYIKEFLDKNLVDRTSKHLTIKSTRETHFGYDVKELSGNLIPKSYDSPIRKNEYTKKIKKALDLDIPRSYLFYGPPGSGKTTIVSSIINELNFRTFTIEDVHRADISKLKGIFKVFKFDAVIIDDLDHQNTIGAKCLALLEWLKTQVKVVLVTANIINGLNSALIRPGRIDEIIYISSLTEETVRSIIHPHSKLFEDVKDLPVAYIIEIMDRIKINGLDNISSDVEEMKSRASKYLKTFKNTSDEEEDDD